MYVEEGMEIEDIASMYPKMYNEVVEFLEPVIGKVDVGNGSPYLLAERLGVK
jgi:hypothetical protein